MRAIETILIVLAVIAAVLLVLVLFFFTVRVRASIIYNEKKGFRVRISILSIKVYGTGEKKPARVRVSDYKIGKKKPKAKKKPPEEPQKPTKITDILSTIRVIISTFFDRYARFLTVRAVRLNIKVATGDAATTALLYGAVIQGVAYILALLEQLTNLKSLRHSQVNIVPEYTKETTTADIKIVLTLPVWCALSLLYKTGVLGKDDKEEQ
ncbi:MAG: DUF2953 domain-containing protein [Eubacteriales bacterium]